MRDDTREAISGFIQLWLDLCFIKGNLSAANELKPYVEASLAKPGSPLHEFVESYIQPHIQTYIHWLRQRPQLRYRRLCALLSHRPVRDFAAYLCDSMFLVGKVYQSEGITGAELWREANAQFEKALADITLAEFMGTTGNTQDLLSGDSDFGDMVRSALSNIGLKPGTVAGRDGSLHDVLSNRAKIPAFDHLEPNERDIKLYELDLKAALWEISKGKAWEVLLESIRAQTSDRNQQLLWLVRLINGEEPGFARIALIRALRQAVSQLPDIAKQIKASESKYKVEVSEVMPIESRTEDEPTDNIISLFLEQGVDIRKLNTRQLNILNVLLNRIKFGVTQKEYYGKDSEKGKQREKRLKDKIRELQTKPE